MGEHEVNSSDRCNFWYCGRDLGGPYCTFYADSVSLIPYCGPICSRRMKLQERNNPDDDSTDLVIVDSLVDSLDSF